jgi:hypothetical protein
MNSRAVRPILLSGLLPVLLAACAGSAVSASPVATVNSSAPSTDAAAGAPVTQTIDRASVVVAVTWTGPSAGAVFDVKMDNHMMDLASVDMSAAILTNSRGERSSDPTWGGGASGHHREGSLSFAGLPADFLSSGGWIQVELPAVGDGTPRDYRWDVPK